MEHYRFVCLKRGTASDSEKEKKRIERKIRLLTEEGWTLKEIVTPIGKPDKQLGIFHKTADL